MCIQSLARIAESHIVIAPSKHQVIVNPQNGKRERIYVNLEAVYPSPEEPGTELSFEELWAASRGWLDACWDDDSLVDDHQHAVTDENSPPVEVLSRAVERKLVIHRDVVALDENGAIKDYSKPAKPRKKKVMEVNETQISTYILLPYNLFAIVPTPILAPTPCLAATWRQYAAFLFDTSNADPLSLPKSKQT
jgi:checkpoint serine/threonine-protein kinase